MLKTIITNTQIKSKCKYPNNTNIAMLFTTYIQNEKQTTHEKSLTPFYLNLWSMRLPLGVRKLFNILEQQHFLAAASHLSLKNIYWFSNSGQQKYTFSGVVSWSSCTNIRASFVFILSNKSPFSLIMCKAGANWKSIHIDAIILNVWAEDNETMHHTQTHSAGDSHEKDMLLRKTAPIWEWQWQWISHKRLRSPA